jgi:uncharacterized protein
MSESPLKLKLTEAMKDAMRAKDKRVEVDERIDPDDTRITSILDKMLKQRRDSIQQFEAGGRPELAAIEQAEIEVIQEFLPQALSEAELGQIIQTALSASGAQSMQDMGKVMALVKPQVIGRADMGAVSQQIKAALS